MKGCGNMNNSKHVDSHTALESILNTLNYKTHMRIHTAYNITVPAQWQIDHRRNEDQHIVYVKGGKGWYDVEGERIPLEAGRLIFVSNGCLHSSGADPYDLPRIMPIRFGIYDNETMNQIKVFDKPYYSTLIDYQGITFLEKFCAIYDYNSHSERLGNAQICHGILTQILVEFYHQIKEGTIRDNRGIAIKTYIDNHIHHQLKVEEMAKHLGLSTKHLSRIFKNHYGITPKQYLITRIIQQANYYMDDTSLSIGKIAQKLGYMDLYTFSKQYKKVMGYSPVQRRKNQNG